MSVERFPLPELGVRHALLLQGPAGPFMRRFALELRDNGYRVTKVNFHAGDVLFFPPSTPGVDVLAFRGRFDEWPSWLDGLIEERGIDGVFLFGDGRPLHRAAVSRIEAHGGRAWVFEEGYLRPDWITLEEHGVNGHSRMPRDPDFYRRYAPVAPPESARVGPTFSPNAWFSAFNAIAFTHLNGGFPHYRHHRELNAYWHAASYVRNVVRKARFRLAERGMLERFQGPLSGRYFFVPLQVYCDYQLHHSRFDDVVEMIQEVVSFFARDARPSDHLVFKHHPMDRPFREYGSLFARLRRESGLGARLHYCHDLHLPTLLQHARGTITINSTVGLQSIHHKTPVKVLGTAVYDLPGLTHQGSMSDFLIEPGPVDEALYRAFRRWLLRANQCNGSFYRRLPGMRRFTGIRWCAGLTEKERRALLDSAASAAASNSPD